MIIMNRITDRSHSLNLISLRQWIKHKKIVALVIVVTIVVLIMAILIPKFLSLLYINNRVSYHGVAIIDTQASTMRTSFKLNPKPPYIKAKILPERAYQLAYPFLERSFVRRIKGRNRSIDSALTTRQDHVILLDDWYYITRNFRSFYFLQAYLIHAVKVHKDTAEIVVSE